MGTKLIEVALPLDAINAASAREKSIRHGHPSTLHLWWARRPLAACRAVLFSSLVDDPSSPDYRWPADVDGDLTQAAPPRGHSEEEVEAERQRLHDLISELVTWESTTNEEVLGRARAEILRATDGNPPPVLDPFCSGGSIPLEAQRLGLEAHGSDLNPVAVLITKALIEIPPKFANQPPVNPEHQRGTGQGGTFKGARGLAADVRHYGQWMRDEAEKRIGHLYPKVKLPPEQGGGKATVIAWLWARTVTCPNPACGAEMPLVASFWLSKKKGKEAWVEPLVDRSSNTVDFKVRKGNGAPPNETVTRRGARCIVCDTAVPFSHLRRVAKGGALGARMIAIVAEARRGRSYLNADPNQIETAQNASGGWKSESEISHWPGRTNVVEYGMTTFGDLFTPRQLVALTTFSDLVGEARERVQRDAVAAGLLDDGRGIADGGTGATAYADAVATYLAFVVDKCCDYWSTIATWASTGEFIRGTFARQALPMTWDFTECNPFSGSTGNWIAGLEWVERALIQTPASTWSVAKQLDATTSVNGLSAPLISTDPPYYDNIGYADLSDFFYVWLRRSLNRSYSELFATLVTPKSEELIATPYRFGGNKRQAQAFFEQGLGEAFTHMRKSHAAQYPLTVFYAFKQAEDVADIGGNGNGGMVSTGWETMLEGLLTADFTIQGTWPIRTERGARSIGIGTNALASSIVLVCRPREEAAPETTRTEFIRQLRRELPKALHTLQQATIAPVDLAQAAIGPGMAIYSRYRRVLEPNGEPLTVRTALQLINQALDEVLAGQDAEHDRDTGWAVAWFEQNGMKEGTFGEAEGLAKAKNISIPGLVEAGILQAGRGRVKLLGRDELRDDWDPATERRLTDWEIAQYLIRALERGGELEAAVLKARIGSRADLAKDLSYRLYTVCERKGRAQEALAYNGLVVAWPRIVAQAEEMPGASQQAVLELS